MNAEHQTNMPPAFVYSCRRPAVPARPRALA
jgi:hypothetical protein